MANESPQPLASESNVGEEEPVKTACILVNLGTPDAPDPASVRRYLREFLSDPRVIEVPRVIWWVILRLFILTRRPGPVSRLYAGVWDGDSPIRTYTLSLAEKVAHRLRTRGHPDRITVHAAMTYGRPALRGLLRELVDAGCEQVIVLPMYPQYSATTTAAVFDQCAREFARMRNLPAFHMFREYAEHPRYIGALAATVREHRARHGAAQRLLMSFHGIPQDYADRGDPYPESCARTARALAAALGLADDEWALTFQSRFGPRAWLQPYTDETLAEWGRSGLESVDVICPGFSVDCLETLEEIAVENREVFTGAGGGELRYIPALNDSDAHADLYAELLETRLD